MKFALTNESYMYDEEEEKPSYLQYARLVNGYVIDQRTTDDPRKIPIYKNKPDDAMKMWFDSGERHRIIDGWITRDKPREFYMIEFNDFDELDSFIDKIEYDVILENKKAFRFGEEYIRVLHVKDS